MKNLSLFVSAFALCASTSFAAINCSTLPECSDLGYSDTVTECPKSVNGEEMVVKCPFDTAKGKCVYEAAVGQIGYFTKAPNTASGWLLCDGKSYSYTKYPQLAKLIGTQFGGTKDNTFTVPDYRGFFLRVYAQGSLSSYVRSDFSTYSGNVNTSFTSPQKEGVPDIAGSFGSVDDTVRLKANTHTSYPFYTDGRYNYDLDSSGDQNYNANGGGTRMYFKASLSNPVYGSSSGVTPPNFAVYAYIYAGKIVQ